MFSRRTFIAESYDTAVTLRQLVYRLVAAQLIPNNQEQLQPAVHLDGRRSPQRHVPRADRHHARAKVAQFEAGETVRCSGRRAGWPLAGSLTTSKRAAWRSSTLHRSSIRVPGVADENLESLAELVTRRISEQLGAGRLDELLAIAAQQAAAAVEGKFGGEGHLTATVGVAGAGEGTAAVDVANPEAADAVKLPTLALDLRGRSPQDINLAINLFMAAMQVFQVALTLYQIVHGEPPSQTQIIQIFNQTTTVINQTTNNVINMPPTHG
jgi:hypothetical protein